MPTVTLNRRALEQLLGRKLPEEQLKERISMLGTDLEKVDRDEIVVEVFPNRPDLLSEQGFGRALAAFIGSAPGLRGYEVKRSGWTTRVVKTLNRWPSAVTAVVRGLSLSDERVREIIQLQEKLGVTLLRNRTKGGLGVYPLDRIRMPVTFTTRAADEIRFRPLEFPSTLTGREILEKHPTGRKYGHLIASEKEFPIFLDAAGTILSMPPIINSHEAGKVTPATRDVFIEATGPELGTLQVALNIFVTALADMGGAIYSMKVAYQEKTLTTPDLKPTAMAFELDDARRLLGIALNEKQLAMLLGRMGYGLAGKLVLVPAYRADVLHSADIIEDLAIAYGYENIPEEIPRVATIAEEDALQRFLWMIGELLIGFGFLELQNYHLLSETEADDAIALRNALGEHGSLRKRLLPGLLKVLASNQHQEYPQQVYEAGVVFSRDAKAEHGIRERLKLGLLVCHEKADVTSIRQVVDALERGLGLQLTVQDGADELLIPGRVGTVFAGKEQIGVFGEVHPAVLNRWKLAMPAAAAELDVEGLFRAVSKRLRKG